MIMGALVAKVGAGQGGNKFGRNPRGDRLVHFCLQQNLVISNTFFKLHSRRPYTWTSLASFKWNIVENLMNFILLNQRFQRYVKSVETYPDKPVVTECRLHGFRKLTQTEEMWSTIEIIVTNIQEQQTRLRKKEQEILLLTNERRKYKLKPKLYGIINGANKRKCRKTRDYWLQNG